MSKPLPAPLQVAVNSIEIGIIPKHQYYYEGMGIAFIDNRYFDAGNATNNLGYVMRIILDEREPTMICLGLFGY